MLLATARRKKLKITFLTLLALFGLVARVFAAECEDPRSRGIFVPRQPGAPVCRTDTTVPPPRGIRSAVRPPASILIEQYLRDFLASHPFYMGKSLSDEKLASIYRDLMHGVGLCSSDQVLKDSDWRFLHDLTVEGRGLSREQLLAIANNFANARNFVAGRYAGPYSGYTRGDFWGMKRSVTPGAPGLPGSCEYGWLRPGEKTKYVWGQ
jgi:hypothetical protein